MSPLETLNIQKLQTLIELLQSITSKEVRIKRLETCDYTGSDLLKNGTGSESVFVTTKELQAFIDYFEACKTNGEAKDMVIGIYTHSNNCKINNSIGLCDYKDADFAEVVVQTSEYIISIKINYKKIYVINQRLKERLGHYIKVDKVEWKKLEDIRNKPNRREVLLNRVVCSFASIYECVAEVKIKSKDEMIHILEEAKTITFEDVVNQINTEGFTNIISTLKVLVFTYEDELLEMMKFIYNNLKDGSVRLVGSGAVNDKTYLTFEHAGTEMEIELNMERLLVGIRVK